MRRLIAALPLAALLAAPSPAQQTDEDLILEMERAISDRDGTPPPAQADAETEGDGAAGRDPFATTAGATPSPAEAGDGLVDGSDPAAVLRAAQTLGEAGLTTDDVGDPLIEATVGGIDYQVFFYGCEGGEDCTSILIGAGFDLAEPVPAETVNAWNRTQRFTRAYVDGEGDPIVEFDVNLAHGVSPANLADTFDWWRVMLADFTGHIGF